MSDKTIRQFSFDIFEDEEEKSPEFVKKEVIGNAYFLLDLNLPRSPRRKSSESILKKPKEETASDDDDVEVDGGELSFRNKVLKKEETSKNQNNLPKFGFVEMLEKVHGKDLISNNPWINAKAGEAYWKNGPKKTVRFCTTEINGKREELPHCQRSNPKLKYGSLHAPSCKNAAHETVEVLGEHVWQNRGFILDLYIKKAQRRYARSRSNSASDNEDEVGYYKARRESLEEIGVFDSVELAKIRMGMESDSPQDPEPEPSTSQQSSRTSLSLPDSAQLNLELSSPISDEECPTTASTLKHLSDAAVTSSPADVFSWPSPVTKQQANLLSSKPPHHHEVAATSSQHSSSSSSQSASQTDNRNEMEQEPATSDMSLQSQFNSTENTFRFEMFTPPKYSKSISNSDYGSEEAEEDLEKEKSISAMLENLTTKTTPITYSPSESEKSEKVTVTIEPPTPSTCEPKIRNSFMSSDESARLRGVVKVNRKMSEGSEGPSCSGSGSSKEEKEDFTQFMFGNVS